MKKDKYNTVAFLAREGGLAVLKSLLKWDCIQLNAVYTHGIKPKAQGYGERDELQRFKEICHNHKVPLIIVDYPLTKDLLSIYTQGQQDLLICLSWRALIPKEILEQINILSVNIHRGLLPTYAGAEPVKKALLAGEKYCGITLHSMTSIIDSGDILSEYKLLCPSVDTKNLESVVECIKQSFTKLYSPLLKATLESIL